MGKTVEKASVLALIAASTKLAYLHMWESYGLITE